MCIRDRPLAAEAAARSQPSAIPDSEPTQYTILVTVMGKVENPGVVLMPMGSTVMDAILRAGGPLADGDLSDLDLERKLSLIHISSKSPCSKGFCRGRYIG